MYECRCWKTKSIAWFMLDVWRDGKHCLTESWPDGWPRLRMPWLSSLLSDWLCPDGRHLLSCNTFIHDQKRSVLKATEGQGDAHDPFSYPSEENFGEEHVCLHKVIVQNRGTICKTSLLRFSRPCDMYLLHNTTRIIISSTEVTKHEYNMFRCLILNIFDIHTWI